MSEKLVCCTCRFFSAGECYVNPPDVGRDRMESVDTYVSNNRPACRFYKPVDSCPMEPVAVDIGEDGELRGEVRIIFERSAGESDTTTKDQEDQEVADLFSW